MIRRAGRPVSDHQPGEEWFHFAGDRIQRHVDRVLNLDEVMGYLAQWVIGA